MNHYVKIAGAVCAGVLGAKIVEAGVKRVAGMIATAAARVAGDNNEAEDEAPAEEAPKPKKPNGKNKGKTNNGNKKPNEGKKEDKPQQNQEQKEA